MPGDGSKMHQTVTFKVSLPFRIKKEGEYFISHCPILDIWSQGQSEKRAISNLIEAVQLFLMNCFERGALNKVLKECGFMAIKKPLPKRQTTVPQIDVPLPFIINQQLAQCRD